MTDPIAESDPVLITCERCKRQVPHEKSESLRFASKHKGTTLRLCNECFLSAREVFIDWLGGDKIQS